MPLLITPTFWIIEELISMNHLIMLPSTSIHMDIPIQACEEAALEEQSLHTF